MNSHFLKPFAVTCAALIFGAASAYGQGSEILVDEGADTTWIEPAQNLPNDATPLAWIQPGYDTSQDDGKGDNDSGANWQAGTLGVGYSDADDNTLVPDDNSTIAIYTRTEFTVSDIRTIESMTWEANYDDGYVAYLNGVELTRDNVSGTPEWNTTASGGHEAAGLLEPPFEPPVDVSSSVSLLVEGTNLLAISNHNVGPDSSDMTMIPRLTIVRDDDPFEVDPVGGLKEEGDGHTFEVELRGAVAPVTYEWTRNGTPVGPNSATFSIPSLTTGDSGTYVCTVTDSATKAEFTTAPVNLNVVPAGSLPAANIFTLLAAALSIALLGAAFIRFRPNPTRAK